MPKRSKEETEITIQTILDVVVDQILNLGYDKMSYTTLSEQTGISRTGISHHFPRKIDFVAALDSKIYQLLISYLDLDSGIQSFRESWIKALKQPQFIAVLRLIFHHIISTEGSAEFSRKGLDCVYSQIKDNLGEDAEKELEWLIGKSLIVMGQ
ncbi:hypothetical protein VA7868_03359 [Vibrio aerogenes CECT 7868]|uniref:DNA-binding transcriptional repressor AcrR n=1 Tax=Vibrio aerogenes CECT 7868 TaxID=1216006 RepID=A0A1M5ZWT2_9VIBR|nr:TetR/AcrR family transcriptional regulator [Vibrio aerogenes]SHI28724.1 hypothetical protein VA7868_03359 [Vibrio aerogenes CECT 7868]